MPLPRFRVWCLFGWQERLCGGARRARVRTGSDRAGVVLLPCRWGGLCWSSGCWEGTQPFPAGEERAGQSGLIFRMRWQAWRARRAGMCQIW